MVKRTCTFPGCDSPHKARGWCGNHYLQWRTTGEVKPAVWAKAGADCVVCGEPVKPNSGRRKHCSGACQVADSRHAGARPATLVCDFCGETFPLTRARTGRLQRVDTKWCPDCGRTSPDVLRYRRYGITKEFWEAESPKGCQICGTTDGQLHVDHDHNCCPAQQRCCGKCVRGLICGPCNRGIGLLRDDHELVAKAAAYLREYAEP